MKSHNLLYKLRFAARVIKMHGHEQSTSTPLSARKRSTVKLYRRLLARCNTENEVNLVHIALANRLTPEEIHELCVDAPKTERLLKVYGFVAKHLNRVFPRVPTSMQREWKARMMLWSARSGSRVPEAYRRRRIDPKMTFYSSGGAPHRKTLAVCFTDLTNRLFMPIPTFLQHLSSADYDILMLKGAELLDFAHAIGCVSHDLASLATTIDRAVGRRHYKSVVTFGASAGGLPALALCVMAEYDKGVCVSGAALSSQTPDGRELTRLLETQSGAKSSVNLLAVFSGDSTQDRKAAASMANHGQIKTLQVLSKTGEIGHNPLRPLLAAGTLKTFLASLLDPRTDGFPDGNGGHADTLVIKHSRPPSDVWRQPWGWRDEN